VEQPVTAKGNRKGKLIPPTTLDLPNITIPSAHSSDALEYEINLTVDGDILFQYMFEIEVSPAKPVAWKIVTDNLVQGIMSGEPLDLLAKIRGVYLVDEFDNAVAMGEESNYSSPSLIISFQRPEGWAGEENDEAPEDGAMEVQIGGGSSSSSAIGSVSKVPKRKRDKASAVNEEEKELENEENGEDPEVLSFTLQLVRGAVTEKNSKGHKVADVAGYVLAEGTVLSSNSAPSQVWMSVSTDKSGKIFLRNYFRHAITLRPLMLGL
jgi:hypothetical protein